MKLNFKRGKYFENDEYDLGYALDNNTVDASSQIKNLLACLPGENDGADWHWLVELENSKLAYLRGGCDYTGWDCQSHVQLVNEYESLDHALSMLGLPTSCVNSDKQIRDEFRKVLEKNE